MHLRLAVCSVRHLVNTHTPAVLQWTFQALYLLHKALHSGRRHMTFWCSKQLNHTLLLSSLMWLSLLHYKLQQVVVFCVLLLMQSFFVLVTARSVCSTAFCVCQLSVMLVHWLQFLFDAELMMRCSLIQTASYKPCRKCLVSNVNFSRKFFCIISWVLSLSCLCLLLTCD